MRLFVLRWQASWTTRSWWRSRPTWTPRAWTRWEPTTRSTASTRTSTSPTTPWCTTEAWRWSWATRNGWKRCMCCSWKTAWCCSRNRWTGHPHMLSYSPAVILMFSKVSEPGEGWHNKTKNYRFFHRSDKKVNNNSFQFFFQKNQSRKTSLFSLLTNDKYFWNLQGDANGGTGQIERPSSWDWIKVDEYLLKNYPGVNIYS